MSAVKLNRASLLLHWPNALRPWARVDLVARDGAEMTKSGTPLTGINLSTNVLSSSDP